MGEGVVMAGEVVNESENGRYPVELARGAGQLRKRGVDVEILDVKGMTKLGMGALLGVAQGSTQPGRTVIMRWNGGKHGDQPVGFIAKGVCFDTGGISIKGAASMEDMKGDMAGAACVVGLMHALAARKARVNAVGGIGLVENMPDGNAQRPGDIVTSMSGQTIEIINTDAEGRLVLADVLWYAKSRFKPKFMIDLATLTGAIVVAPVSVARSIMNFGLNRLLAYHSTSASTSRPSASVLMISMVWPDIEVTMSPGRCALPSGIFSTRPIPPTALTLALRAASACIRPTTQAAPAMSPFMSSMPAACLIETPPVSKQTPLPMNAAGDAPRLPPFHRMMTVRLSCREPWPTPSSAPMPSRFIAPTSRTSTTTSSLRNRAARRANSSGYRPFAGPFLRSP